ncbi:MAG: hypothetical protein ICV87_07030 [Gemmatimonadetes bacterium]|nr:hypothetical protein [Gemmatimonadota bacterium]
MVAIAHLHLAEIGLAVGDLASARRALHAARERAVRKPTLEWLGQIEARITAAEHDEEAAPCSAGGE